MTWKAGVDAVSFGGTKNGCLGVEAVIFFNPENAWEFELRRKRSAHLFSKHRYLSAQMLGYLLMIGCTRRRPPMPAPRGWPRGCAPCRGPRWSIAARST